MDTIETLKDYFNRIKSGCDIPTRFEFVTKLIQNNAPEFLDFHYSLIAEKETQAELYDLIIPSCVQRCNFQNLNATWYYAEQLSLEF